MMANRSKEKGTRYEYRCEKAWQDAGFSCERVPLSGALGGEMSGDLHLWVGNIRLKGQCKCKKNGFAVAYKELETHDFIEVKADYKPDLILFEKSKLLLIMKELQDNKELP